MDKKLNLFYIHLQTLDFEVQQQLMPEFLASILSVQTMIGRSLSPTIVWDYIKRNKLPIQNNGESYCNILLHSHLFWTGFPFHDVLTALIDDGKCLKHLILVLCAWQFFIVGLVMFTD